MSETLRSIGKLKLFTGVPQLENFATIKSSLPVREMAPSSAPQPWAEGERIELPEEFPLGSAERFLADTDTVALLVLRDGEVRYENYWHTGGRDVQWISMSVGKSFVSALVGMLVDEGRITSIDDAISDYIRVEPGSAYDGVSIRNVLLMSSGGRWVEDYSNKESDVQGLSAALEGVDGGLDGFVATRERELEPGTVCRYNSGDTQALGALVRATSGESLADLMQRRLVEPLGMENAGYWLVDPQGVEAAFGGLNLTARDFARFGELYRLNGEWNGTRLISEEWVRDSTTVTADQCAIGAQGIPLGYGFQWWLPESAHGAFVAVGVYNQFIFVDPVTNTTIVKLSAAQQYGTRADGVGDYSMENAVFLGWLAAQEF